MEYICSKCKEVKDSALFSFRNKSKGILHTQCKACISVLTKKHYVNNRKDVISRASAWNNDNLKRRRVICRNSYAKMKGYPRCECCDIEDINKFLENCPEGHHVDHIDSVRYKGHHCLKNLQYLTVVEHARKSGYGY